VTEDEVALLVAAALLLIGALVARGVVAAAADGRLTSNAFAGLRTGATRSSPEAWQAGHAAGRRLVDLGALVGALLAVVGGAVVLLDGGLDLATGLTLGSAAALLAGVVAGGVRAHRAAREVQRVRGER
jgi:hypothetical protein